MKLISANSAVAATIFTTVFTTLLCIFSSAYAIYDQLGKLLWHHWIFKSIIASMLWLLLAMYPFKFDYLKAKYLAWTLVVSLLAIQIFFIAHYFYIT